MADDEINVTSVFGSSEQQSHRETRFAAAGLSRYSGAATSTYAEQLRPTMARP